MGKIYFWKKAPFVRLFISLATGILIQWYWPVALTTWCFVLIAVVISHISLLYMPLFKRYRFNFFIGSVALVYVSITGALLTAYKDIRNDGCWMGKHLRQHNTFIVTLEESPVEKTKSFKSTASILYLLDDSGALAVRGAIILYFQKDSLVPGLKYGSQILFKKPVQEIKNSGNPGSFDYKRYSLFQGVSHQVYLHPRDFIVLNTTHTNKLQTFLETNRRKILAILRKYIKGDRELGLAEALLIGYKNDLDKTLVQSYSNTGVVHVIAISGLHLGLIYGILLLLIKPLQRYKPLKWLRPLFLLSGIWVFTLMAGAQPSILRSAVMFTCIIAGENLTKRTSILNNLALSAFLLLCYNPFWLWDVGFQLSYSAVLSIVIFMKPVYNLFYIKNKLLDFFWKLNAVTIAAQLLTLPISIFHFHQFPVHFLLTNMVAVPLSSIILVGEIILCVIALLPTVAQLAGRVLTWLIRLMNEYIEAIEDLPFSLLEGLLVNGAQAILLFIFIAGLSYWFLEKIKPGLYTALIALFGFFIIRSHSLIEKNRQQQIIVYNVQQHRAIDFIKGRRFFFIGDPETEQNVFIKNFHLKPARTLHRAGSRGTIGCLATNKHYISFGNKKIMLLDSTVIYASSTSKQTIDLLVVSKTSRFYASRLSSSFRIKQIVFDASLPASKVKYWKKDCDSLHIPYHDVIEKGAFVMTLN